LLMPSFAILPLLLVISLTLSSLFVWTLFLFVFLVVILLFITLFVSVVHHFVVSLGAVCCLMELCFSLVFLSYFCVIFITLPLLSLIDLVFDWFDWFYHRPLRSLSLHYFLNPLRSPSYVLTCLKHRLFVSRLIISRTQMCSLLPQWSFCSSLHTALVIFCSPSHWDTKALWLLLSQFPFFRYIAFLRHFKFIAFFRVLSNSPISFSVS
jgi:hypothetical protein